MYKLIEGKTMKSLMISLGLSIGLMSVNAGAYTEDSLYQFSGKKGTSSSGVVIPGHNLEINVQKDLYRSLKKGGSVRLYIIE